MKSRYFTPENITDKSLEMLSRLEKFRNSHKIKFILERSALLILDMQKYFLEESSHAFIPSALPIIPGIKRLAKVYEELNLPIILTRHLNSEGDAGLLAKWWKDLITEGDELSEIIPELNLPNSIIIRKTRYDGFYRTPLEDILREKGVSQLVITGVMSHLCCETTARSAFVRDFAVFIPINGTATYNEDFHRAAFLNLAHGFATPVLVDELLNLMEAPRSGN
ncbi:MAG: cysteine hydrolase [candidate division Zixibacteria bacterium]|nr:cysteine hydrolase [Candidatus Tariuqbacter arcticus]